MSQHDQLYMPVIKIINKHNVIAVYWFKLQTIQAMVILCLGFYVFVGNRFLSRSAQLAFIA